MNDPFDIIPALPTHVTAQDVRTYLEATNGRFFPVAPVKPVDVARVKERVDRICSDPYRLWPEQMEGVRLICTSSRSDGVLLWSHYANYHKGFAVGFNTDVLYEGMKECLFFKVDYDVRRIAIEITDFINHEASWGKFHTLYSRKSPEWSYEEEWRAMLSTKNLEDPAWLSFSEDAIDSVILGALIQPEMEARIKRACEEANILDRVKLKRATLDREQFVIHIANSTWKV